MLRRELGETKVDQLDDAVAPHHHVLGLDVAMHKPRAVRRRERRRDLKRDVDKVRDSQRAGVDGFAQRRAIDELRRDEVDVLGVADFIHRDDVRMIQGRGRARFVFKPASESSIEEQLGRQDLQRDASSQRRVRRAIDLAHAARSEPRHDLVAPQRVPDERRCLSLADPAGREVLAEPVPTAGGVPSVQRQERRHFAMQLRVGAAALEKEGVALVERPFDRRMKQIHNALPPDGVSEDRTRGTGMHLRCAFVRPHGTGELSLRLSW